LLDPTKMTCKNRFLGRLIGEAFIELLRLFQNFEKDLNLIYSNFFLKALQKWTLQIQVYYWYNFKSCSARPRISAKTWKSYLGFVNSS
jgi:hypothetical protein